MPRADERPTERTRQAFDKSQDAEWTISMDSRPDAPPRVGLFVTCLVDAMRPQIGFAALQLLEEAGCTVEVPQAQTCCGQPAFNSGDTAHAAGLARQVDRGLRALRLCRGAVGLLRRDDPPALPRGARRRPRLAGARGGARPEDLRDHQLPGRRPRLPAQGARLRRDGHLPRQLRGPARARRLRPAAPAARRRGGPAR